MIWNLWGLRFSVLFNFQVAYRKVRNKSRGLYFSFAIFSAACMRGRLINEGVLYWADFKMERGVHFPRLLASLFCTLMTNKWPLFKIFVLKNIYIKFCRAFILYNFPFGALFLAVKLVWKLAFFQLLLSKPKHKSDNFYKRHPFRNIWSLTTAYF